MTMTITTKQKSYVNLGRTPEEKKLIDTKVAITAIEQQVDKIVCDLFQLKSQLKSLSLR